MGEAYISKGEIELGVEHLANAVVVCGQPAQLLQVLQQTLPAQVFTLLVQRMRQYGNKGPTAEEDDTRDRITESINDELE